MENYLYICRNNYNSIKITIMEIEVGIGLKKLTKNFIRANRGILYANKDYIDYVTGININKINTEFPVYMGISEGKAMQRMDIMNISKDFTKVVVLAKSKIENGKTTTTK